MTGALNFDAKFLTPIALYASNHATERSSYSGRSHPHVAFFPLFQ